MPGHAVAVVNANDIPPTNADGSRIPIPNSDLFYLTGIEQLFGKLRRYSLVDSVRGPGGGYCIARPLNMVTVADIVRAVDEPLDATQCGGRENCLDDHRCMTHDLWAALNAKMYDYLSSVTLADLAERQRAKEAKTGSAAVIEDRRVGPQPRTRATRDKVAAVV